AGLRAGLSGHIYSASKAAVIHLSRSVAAELSPKGVRVNTISPGGIVTAIFAKAAGLEGTKAERALGVIADLVTTVQPIPRAGITDDIARAAVFLERRGVVHHWTGHRGRRRRGPAREVRLGGEPRLPCGDRPAGPIPGRPVGLIPTFSAHT